MEQSSPTQASAPVGEGNYEVQPGDCMASIAGEAGFAWQTIWNHPNNVSLRKQRPDPNVLLPGDRVYVPSRQIRVEDCATNRQHRFVRRDVPETLKFVLLDRKGQPRSDLEYVLFVDGDSSTGRTGPDGIVTRAIPPNARTGRLIVRTEQGEERYDLFLGQLDPVTVTTGVQARLNNLGFLCGVVDGILGARTRRALEEFQTSQSLPRTGQIDVATQAALVREHGF